MGISEFSTRNCHGLARILEVGMPTISTEPVETVACEICLREIPRSVSTSGEGTDYVYYFCGERCYEQWLAQTGESTDAERDRR